MRLSDATSVSEHARAFMLAYMWGGWRVDRDIVLCGFGEVMVMVREVKDGGFGIQFVRVLRVFVKCLSQRTVWRAKKARASALNRIRIRKSVCMHARI